jgi:hypothetical protein
LSLTSDSKRRDRKRRLLALADVLECVLARAPAPVSRSFTGASLRLLAAWARVVAHARILRWCRGEAVIKALEVEIKNLADMGIEAKWGRESPDAPSRCLPAEEVR